LRAVGRPFGIELVRGGFGGFKFFLLSQKPV
jgi:hypothetical protein